jgi:hypothetical protein
MVVPKSLKKEEGMRDPSHSLRQRERRKIARVEFLISNLTSATNSPVHSPSGVVCGSRWSRGYQSLMLLIGHDKDSITTFLLRLSCILSILGSTIVMTACRFPETMRQKKGRQLIFWLSFSDFGTSLVYFLSSFEHSSTNTTLCKSYALLGIFFPIASFIWTDAIAWHIYITIAERKIKTNQEWLTLMKLFHCVAWGVGGGCIFIIALFDHEGRGGENTGGWCWVEASEKTLIYWELIGGKFIEWCSCFLWLPVMYLLTIRTLYLLERSDSVTLINSIRRNESTRTSSGALSFPASANHNPLFGNKRFRIFYFKMVLCLPLPPSQPSPPLH